MAAVSQEEGSKLEGRLTADGHIAQQMQHYANALAGLFRREARLALIRVCWGDAPDFVEVGEAGIAMDDAMRRQRRVQLVG